MFSIFQKGSGKSPRGATDFNFAGTDIDIRSADIDRTKFSVANWEKMKEKFKDYYIDRATRDNKERPYSPTEVNDETIARYLLARNDNYDKASALLEAVLKWREVNLPVLKDECYDALETQRLSINGVDKLGHPLLIASMPDTVTKFSILLDFSGQTNGTDIEFMRHFGKIFQ
eukprot:gene37173-48575_t